MTATPMTTTTDTAAGSRAGARRSGNPFALIRRGLVYLLLSIAAFVSVFPFFWMIVGTTNTSADIIRGKASFGSAFFDNAATFFTQVDALRVFWNSAVIAIVGTVLTFPLYFNLIRKIGPGKAAYTSVLIPVVAMMLSTIFEGYRWSTLAAAGAALAMVGLLAAMQARKT